MPLNAVYLDLELSTLLILFRESKEDAPDNSIEVRRLAGGTVGPLLKLSLAEADQLANALKELIALRETREPVVWLSLVEANQLANALKELIALRETREPVA